MGSSRITGITFWGPMLLAGITGAMMVRKPKLLGRDILLVNCFIRNLLKTNCPWDDGAKKKPVNNGISTINLNWLHSRISGCHQRGVEVEVLWIQFVVLKQNLGFFSSRVGLSGGSDMT